MFLIYETLFLLGSVGIKRLIKLIPRFWFLEVLRQEDFFIDFQSLWRWRPFQLEAVGLVFDLSWSLKTFWHFRNQTRDGEMIDGQLWEILLEKKMIAFVFVLLQFLSEFVFHFQFVFLVFSENFLQNFLDVKFLLDFIILELQRLMKTIPKS